MFRIIISLMAVFCCCQVIAASVDIRHLGTEPVTLENKMQHVSVLDCPQVSVRTVGQCENLRLIDKASANFGFMAEPRWFLFSLHNSADVEGQVYVEIDYALLDQIQFFVLDEKGRVTSSYITGDLTPFDSRPIDYPSFVFPIGIDAGASVEIRFLVETGSSLQVPVKLWSPETFVAAKSNQLMLFGLFVGAMVIMAIYNLMLLLSTRDKSYLYFAATLLFYALAQGDLTGLSFRHLWPDLVAWNDKSLIVVSSVALISLCMFSKTFLRLDENSTYTNLLINGVLGFLVLWAMCSVLISYHILIVVNAGLLMFLPTILYIKGIHLWSKGYIPARYFVLAFTCFVFAVCVFTLNKYGVLERNGFTEFSMHFGAAAVVTLLSLALADQVNQEKRAREKAQASAIVSLRKFEEIYNNSSEGMFRLSLEGRFLSANQAFLNMLQADSVAAIQARYQHFSAMFVEPSDIFERLHERGQIKDDLALKKVDGSQLWGVLNLRIVDDSTDGKTVVEGSLIDISDRKASERQLTYLANYDQLTGLINRNAFQDRLKRLITSAQQHEHEHSLLYIDLDRFKLVNDTCGHLAGDELLKQLGVMFTHKIRQRDATARIGGDEFAILLENCEIDKAVYIGDELKRELNKFRFNWQGKQFDIGASIGIVAINQYSESVVSLLNLADSVCLMAKEQGRNRVVVHDEQESVINEKIQAKNLLATIHEAIESNNFVLYKQQIVSIAEPESHCYELLVRLRVGDEIVGPGVFIPTAERYNVMAGLDRWVISEFVGYLHEHPEELAEIDMVTINLSGQTLSNPDFLPYLLKLLENNPEISNKLCFELTESAALNNLSESSNLVTQMKALGAKFAVDDFGSGYASYSYLTQLPIDFVKIDGSFCVDIETSPVNQMVVRSITEISHTMGTKVIAEFVESKAALSCLQEIGVDMVQGYYLDKPSPLVLQGECLAEPLELEPAFHT